MAAAFRRVRLNGYSRLVFIRPAIPAERDALEALQLRASLGNEGDREALLRHPDAIDLPMEQITAGAVFVVEQHGAVVGFSTIVAREDGDTELDALFVEPSTQRQASANGWWNIARRSRARRDRPACMWSATLTPNSFISPAVSASSADSTLDSGRVC